MDIVLVRHGEPEWVRDDLNVDNPPLTDRGHRQAHEVARALHGESFDEVWVSPLVRARQTARPLLDDRRLDEPIQEWLEEIRNPLWHGTPRERADAAYAEERRRPSEKRWEGLVGGEPVRDFVDRIHTNAGFFFAERGLRPTSGSLPVWEIDACPSTNRSHSHGVAGRPRRWQMRTLFVPAWATRRIRRSGSSISHTGRLPEVGRSPRSAKKKPALVWMRSTKSRT
ncbi:MAG: hypothetical protein RIU67_360, partial [Actinomycetota bacterium]